jgi:hypothetical protein
MITPASAAAASQITATSRLRPAGRSSVVMMDADVVEHRRGEVEVAALDNPGQPTEGVGGCGHAEVGLVQCACIDRDSVVGADGCHVSQALNTSRSAELEREHVAKVLAAQDVEDFRYCPMADRRREVKVLIAERPRSREKGRS